MFLNLSFLIASSLLERFVPILSEDFEENSNASFLLAASTFLNNEFIKIHLQQ